MTEIEFLRAERDHYKAMCQRLVTELETVAYLSRCAASQSVTQLPPEPPVGTRYVDPDTSKTLWERRDDGWHCARENCRNCPADWHEFQDWAPPANAQRVLPEGVTA